MAYSPPKYPSQIPTQTGADPDLPDKADDIDWMMAFWFNAIKKELCAIMTELGTLPKGAFSDVKARLEDIESKLVPTGTIVMWSGTLANIPSGWALCDGQDGRPNLLDKFVKGVPNGSTDPGSIGGSDTHYHTQPTHTHTGPSHTHSGPNHNHSVSLSTDVAPNPASSGPDDYSFEAAQGNHQHNVSGNTGNAGTGQTGAGGTGATSSAGGDNTNTVNHEPPYYEIAYIIKL